MKDLKFLNRPVTIFAILLAIYTIVTILINFSIEVLISAMQIFGIIIALHFILKFFNITFPITDTLISAMIFFLLLDPQTSILNVLLIVILFFIFKKVRFKAMPLFNPVVISLIVLYYISLLVPFIEEPLILWWGAAYMGYTSTLLLLPVVGYALFKFRRHYYFISIFAAFILIDLIINGFSYFNLIFGTYYFAIGIMFSEIKTSPLKIKEQIIFGITGGILLFLSNHYDLNNPIIHSILMLNILYFIKKKYVPNMF